MNYDEAVKYIFNIPRFDMRGKTGNDNLIKVLKLLDMPHEKHRCIHIAGTNGKGSTANFIKSILVSAGFNVGIFTSPHLVRVNERICTVMEGKEECISDEDFLRIFKLVEEKNKLLIAEGNPHISFFEFVFTMAAAYFAKKQLDYVIYETGLGGRLDATNIITPDISIITSIGLDHTKYLGDTIAQIAYEKAGIIKEGVPVVFNTGEPEADRVICKTAKEKGAEAFNVAKTKYIINEITDKTIDFSVSGSYYSYDNLRINSCAVYQLDNALTAIHACHVLFGASKYKENVIAAANIKKALGSFLWEGRMERIHKRVFLDGAHNEDAIYRFVETVNMLNGEADIILLYATSSDKNYVQIIKYLCDNLKMSSVYITQLESDRLVSAERIKDIFDKNLKKQKTCITKAYKNIKEAYEAALGEAEEKNKMLYCAGSLYLIGSIKEFA